MTSRTSAVLALLALLLLLASASAPAAGAEGLADDGTAASYSCTFAGQSATITHTTVVPAAANPPTTAGR